MTAGGRWKGSRPHPVAIQRRTPAASIPAACVTETFDGADASGFGPDQPWNTYLSGGAAPHRVSGELHLAASTGGSSIWAIGRAETDAASADMTVTTPVTAVGTTGTSAGEFDSYTFNLLARMEETDGGPSDMTAGLYTGWQFYFMNYDFGGTPTAYCEIGLFIDPSSPTEHSGIVTADPVSLVAPGDVLAVAVTGTGTGTVVTGKLNGSTVVELSGTDLTDFLTTHSIDPADLPAGPRGGCGFVAFTSSHAWDSGNDDQLALGSFEVCPA